jgi:anti-anti-sigma factor
MATNLNRPHPATSVQVTVADQVVRDLADGVAATVTGHDGAVLATISWHPSSIPADSEARGSSTVIAVDGDVDVDTVPLLRTALLQAVSTRRSVCCDLSRVTFFGAAGANTLLSVHHHALRLGHVLLLRGADGMTAEVLSICGLDKLIAPGSDRPR